MTVYTLVAPIPAITVAPLMILKLEAINPTTGANVSGVTFSQWAIYGSKPDDASSGTPPGPFMLVPGPDTG